MCFTIHLRFIHFTYAFKASINRSIQNTIYIFTYVQQWFSGTGFRRRMEGVFPWHVLSTIIVERVLLT
ncbi:mCG1034530 [Mus musculus]|nr:mCG1034530 [Mus musculus]